MLSEDALPDGDFWGILVGACWSESSDVGVGWGRDWGKKIEAKLAAFQYTGKLLAITTGHTRSPGVYVRQEVCHVLLPGLGAAGEHDVGKQRCSDHSSSPAGAVVSRSPAGNEPQKQFGKSELAPSWAR